MIISTRDVAGKEAALGGALLAVLDFNNLFGRHHDAAELILHRSAVDALGDVAFDRLFHARIGMDDIPTEVRIGRCGKYRGAFRRGFRGGFDSVSHFIFSSPE
jgi:hypothetical protein